MEAFERILDKLIRNEEWAAALAAVTAILCAGVALLVRRLVRKQYERLARTEQTEFMELPLHVVSKTTTLFIFILSVAAGLAVLSLPPKVETLVGSVVAIVLFVQLGLWTSTAVVALIDRRKKTALATDRASVGSLGIIGFIVRGVIWTLVLLLALDNLGIDVTALVAGLGVGGIAVALAVQNLLGDLFASLSITLDKPFVVGDFLILGDFLGSVEHIGIKSVRLRSLSGEQIIIANADLLNSRVRNYGRMNERRVVFSIRVPYETPRAALEKIPGIIRQAIENEAETRFDRSHFAKFAEFSLEFETVYYVLSPDYNRYMDIQQRINFAIHEEFERESIAFAVPTQKLRVFPFGNDDDASPADGAERGREALRT